MSEGLVGELKKEIDHCEVWARRNYNYAHIVFGITVMASFVSAILVGSNAQAWSSVGLGEAGFRFLLTALTAMPAALLLINSTLRFEERSRWFWRKCRKLQRLLRVMRDSESPNSEKVSVELSDVVEDMENDWPVFGTSSTQTKKPGVE